MFWKCFRHKFDDISDNNFVKPKSHFFTLEKYTGEPFQFSAILIKGLIQSSHAYIGETHAL